MLSEHFFCVKVNIEAHDNPTQIIVMLEHETVEFHKQVVSVLSGFTGHKCLVNRCHGDGLTLAVVLLQDLKASLAAVMASLV